MLYTLRKKEITKRCLSVKGEIYCLIKFVNSNMQQEGDDNSILQFIKERNRPVTTAELTVLELKGLDSELLRLLDNNLM